MSGQEERVRELNASIGLLGEIGAAFGYALERHDLLAARYFLGQYCFAAGRMRKMRLISDREYGELTWPLFEAYCDCAKGGRL